MAEHAEHIEREATINALRKWSITADRPRTWMNAFDKAAEIIESITAANVRPTVRGKWRPYSPLTDTYECDKCGYQVIDESFRTNFYPNCGATMEES